MGGEDFHCKPTFRVFCKAGPHLSLAVRNSKVVLAYTDSCDNSQHWVKDDKFGGIMRDEHGCPGFSLVHKANCEALLHEDVPSHCPVRLKPYDPCCEEMNATILWTESEDCGDGFRAIRPVNNVCLTLDGSRGEGVIEENNEILLWETNNYDYQIWCMQPHC